MADLARRDAPAWAWLGMLLGLLAAPLAAFPSPSTVLDYPDAAAVVEYRWGARTVYHDAGEARRIAARIAAQAADQPLSLAWTRLTLEHYIKHKMSPTRGARGLALVHVAMHDAHVLARRYGREPDLAVAGAATGVLGYLFVTEERGFERILEAWLALHPGGGDAPSSLALGQAVADGVIARAQRDGAQYGWNGTRLEWRGEGRYYGPGSWEPTPPYHYFPPDEPFAPRWQTWVLTPDDLDRMRPVPPAFGSARHLQALREVIEVGSRLSADELRIAKFWVDGHGSVTPPGHWNQIADAAAVAAGLDQAATLGLMRDLNLALADAFIATWECKYHYWTARPVTAARRLLGVEFKSAILTPPFPSYVSGHAAFSGAAAEVLAAHLPQRAEEFRAMAQEAANSRLLGGIHFRFDNDDGLALGRRVARVVMQRFTPASARDAANDSLEPSP